MDSASAVRGSGATAIGSVFAAATVALICGAFVVNNLGPYLGLNYAGAMTMYSGLVGGGKNHLFLPGGALSEARGYVSVVDADAAGDRGIAPVRLFQQLATRDGDERPVVHLNVIRYQASRACSSIPGLRIALTMRHDSGRQVEVRNLCADPDFLWYDVVTSYPPCRNAHCQRILERWQDGLEPGR